MYWTRRCSSEGNKDIFHNLSKLTDPISQIYTHRVNLISAATAQSHFCAGHTANVTADTSSNVSKNKILQIAMKF